MVDQTCLNITNIFSLTVTCRITDEKPLINFILSKADYMDYRPTQMYGICGTITHICTEIPVE